MATKSTQHGAQVGDWVKARGLPGQPSRLGQIIELLGQSEHEHYRVRWDERHESILYPADGVIVMGQHPEAGSRPGN